MTIGATELMAVITDAEAMFPGAVVKLYWGEPRDHVVNVLKSDTVESNSVNDLGGIEPGQRLRVRLIVSRCDPWTPPADGDVVDLYTSADVKIGTFSVLGHNDDPTGSIRTLMLGEETA